MIFEPDTDTNLKIETLKALEEAGKTINDILWIGCEEFMIDIDEFWKLADTEYYSGFGGQEVASDLIIVGDNWWLERDKYDGVEWWVYKCKPSTPLKKRDCTALTTRQLPQGVYKWGTLKELNPIEAEVEE